MNSDSKTELRSTATEELKEIYERKEKERLEEFFHFLRFQSISSESEYTGQVLSCAAWVKETMKDLGFQVEEWKTAGHPSLFGSYEKDSSKPTLLIYNHYDVQPVDPLELWDSPPSNHKFAMERSMLAELKTTKANVSTSCKPCACSWSEMGNYPSISSGSLRERKRLAVVA